MKYRSPAVLLALLAPAAALCLGAGCAHASARAPSSEGAPADSTAETQPQADSLAPSRGLPNDDVKDRIKLGHSIAPLVAYDPTYGFIFGVAYFRGSASEVPSRFRIVAFGTTAGGFGFDAKAKHWFEGRWFATLHLAANNLFVPYYGEGDRTSRADRVDIGTRWGEAVPSIGYRWSRELQSTFFTELSYRTETSVAGDPSRRLFGRDFTPALGATIARDTRDNESDSHTGSYSSLRLRYGPGALSNREGGEDFLQLEGESKRFFHVAPRSVLGLQALAGSSFGEPGFLYRFTLGNDHMLRGYSEDRFRGRHYYAGQLEWRQSLNDWISAVAFASAGDVADRSLADFHGPKWSVGPGVRVALPPDRVAKIRLDWGFGGGESAIYLNFNEAF